MFQALEALNKKDITEIKSYGKPPPLVEKVLEAVMILRCQEATWAEAKRQLGELLLDSSVTAWRMRLNFREFQHKYLFESLYYYYYYTWLLFRLIITM